MPKMPEQLSQWIKQKKQPKQSQSDFLINLMDDEKQALSFVDFVVKNPRLNKRIFRFLSQTMPIKSLSLWMEKYALIYNKYIHQKWKKAKKAEDVLKIIPNFSPWALKDRFGQFDLGKIPTDFGDEKNYFKLLDKIRQSDVVQNYKQLKSLENNLKEFEKHYPEIKKINWFDIGQRTHFLSKLMFEKTGHPFFVKIAQQKYKVQFLCNPFSCKMVFEVISPKGQAYILKMTLNPITEILTDDQRKEMENQAIRADSPYTNSMMEFYLKLNKCPHVCDIQHYTSLYEVVLYKKEKGTPLSALGKTWDFYNLNNKLLKDANRLGIYINDVSLSNFILTDQNMVKIIDIGHASFANPLTQGIPGLTFTFGNLSGQDYLTHFGVLSMED